MRLRSGSRFQAHGCGCSSVHSCDPIFCRGLGVSRLLHKDGGNAGSGQEHLPSLLLQSKKNFTESIRFFFLLIPNFER